jgi:hypothetical protein
MNRSVSFPARAADLLRQTLPARLRAAGIHVAISSVIFFVALYLILVQWYPGFHFGVDGGWRGVKIMAGVDLVLGPTLTLIIFNPLKARKLIVFDLACIGLTQLAALVWGFYAIHSQRPVVVSFYEGAFMSATAQPLKTEKYHIAELKTLSDRTPALVFTAEPANDEEGARAAIQEAMGMTGRGGVMHHEDPFFFRRFEEHWGDVKARSIDVARHQQENKAFADELTGFLERRGAKVGDFLYFPFRGRYGECTWAFTPAGEPVDALGCEAY